MAQLSSAPPTWLSTSRRPHVLLLATGSVATVKVPELALRIAEWADVRIVLTARGAHMFERVAPQYDAAAWAALQACDAVSTVTDADEWAEYIDVRRDSVVHIELRRWADVALFAPCSCNTLGKLAHGLCDNLATCVARAWDARKPMVVAPAANTSMWEHPSTARDLDVLVARGVAIVPPVAKRLACGEIGVGALADIDALCAAVKLALAGTARCAEGSDGGGEWRARGFPPWRGDAAPDAARRAIVDAGAADSGRAAPLMRCLCVGVGLGMGLAVGLAVLWRAPRRAGVSDA